MTSGLVISRLGIQATAGDDLVHGLLCLRISIPAQNDSNHAMRWNLFSGQLSPDSKIFGDLDEDEADR